MMDRTLRDKWVAALRSGDYKQGIGQLYRPKENTYCCLGVLCVVAGVEISENGMVCMAADGEPDANYTVMKGLIGRHPHDLWTLNDQKGRSFTEIADYIERNL